MRSLLAVLLASSLGGCITNGNSDPAAGNWTIERKVDRITGAPAPKVYLAARAANSRSGKTDNAIVQLMCFNAQPIVRFAFDFKVGASSTATVEYRFDQKPGHKADAKFLADFKTLVIEDRAAVAQFAGELATSTVLFVRVTSLALGRTEAEFRVPGAAAAIEAGYAECPLRSVS